MNNKTVIIADSERGHFDELIGLPIKFVPKITQDEFKTILPNTLLEVRLADNPERTFFIRKENLEILP